MLREVQFNDLYTTIIVACLAIIVGAKYLKPQRFIDILRLLGNSNYLRIYFKDHKFLDPFDIILFLNFCLNGMLISLLAYIQLVKKIDIDIVLFLKLSVVFGAVVLVKILIELGIGYLFDIQKIFHSYVFQQVSFFNFLGIILLPLNSLLIFGVPNNRFLLTFILSISGLILLIGMLKSIKFYQKLLINNLFYFILYLCTLEIGPYILLCNLFS
ncbi:MAG: DUF4271 domain-containing protein [Flavobacteriaceae bacterium]|jgi:hypothetical protein|nr:DUF4271 domain-containing protein [Flavobacteriaceae bacterium]MDG1385267.1 DUF4271 domain-containing protein [Flavobacteriaceae bacterium]